MPQGSGYGSKPLKKKPMKKKPPAKKAPPGFHYMPNGKLMKNSDMKKKKKK
tara:strand:+ start:1285 stop:1437 length:153 start_codon:yes stop_codon:yes gene_type:complete